MNPTPNLPYNPGPLYEGMLSDYMDTTSIHFYRLLGIRTSKLRNHNLLEASSPQAFPECPKTAYSEQAVTQVVA